MENLLYTAVFSTRIVMERALRYVHYRGSSITELLAKETAAPAKPLPTSEVSWLNVIEA